MLAITQRILKRFTQFGVSQATRVLCLFSRRLLVLEKNLSDFEWAEREKIMRCFCVEKSYLKHVAYWIQKQSGWSEKWSERTLNCTLRDKRINVHLFNYSKEVTLFSHCFFARNRTFLCFPFNCHSVLLYKFWSRSILRMYFSRQ